MKRKTVLVIADLGGCPPHMFYKSVAESYNIVSYIPRPFAITKSHANFIENYSVAVVKDVDYLKKISDFEHPDSIYWAQKEYDKPEEAVVEDIIKVATMFNVEAITTNNELFIAPMAKACEKLGLRGAGVEAAQKARDKNLMRESFNNSGVKAIKSKRVNTLKDFKEALEYVGVPLVLKPTYLASSIGVTFIYNEQDAEKIFLDAQEYLNSIGVPKAVTFEAPFIVEEFLQGEYEDWYTEPGYSDYVSVEGMMVGGKYYPLAIHDKTPQIGFTETAHITSTILDEDAKNKILDAVKKANEGLGLEHCATHTEVKLMKNREVGIIETAARFAGWNMIPNIKKSFNVDAAKVLVDILCEGYSEDLPKELLTDPYNYVADFHLYPHDFKTNGHLLENVSNIIFESIEIPENILVGDTKINSFNTVDKGTQLDLTLFEAFNGLAYLELHGTSSQDIVKSIQEIKKYAKLYLQGVPVTT
ncbi:ATP-grasp domain-containing protein [Priestia megaterium]|uniref:ATP-grasp domain-containing protein n=1 Tax=Priestia megaterium TaxID=1404 RepID=UPI000D51F4EB|nr:ATP-grasp domain-containing protein [Priestia megaterium]PVE64493.1 carboxylate--amine ligase [Priestia megaterium]PVE79958.1 carboxylate--amine ligase [Priestia megaterium]PVE83748.1 carboxylate--amine ligase [Priestia megaterium]PVE93401.1 carboxylate--amine ligase [Priestia megaterium]